MEIFTLLPLLLVFAILALIFFIVRRTKVLQKKVVRIWLASAVIWPATAMGLLILFFERGDFTSEAVLVFLFGPPSLFAMVLLAKSWIAKGR